MSYDPDKLRAALGQMVLDSHGITWAMGDLSQEIKKLENEREHYQERAVELDLERDDLKFRLTKAFKEIERLQSLILPDVIREGHL